MEPQPSLPMILTPLPPGPAPAAPRRGQASPVAAVILIGLLAFLALAIDLGMLFTARVEAQRGADAIALAGASAFISNAPAEYAAEAKARAKDFAARNYVRNKAIDTTTVSETADTWASDEVVVHVIVDSLKVRTHVRRAGLGLWFARLLGIESGGVRAMAAAEAAEASANTCMVPLAIPVDPDQELELGELMVLKSADSAMVSGVDPFFAPVSLAPDSTVPDYCPRAAGLEDGAWGGRNVCSTCDPGNGRFPEEVYGGWHQSTPVDEWLAGEDPSGSYYPGDGYAENVCGNNCSEVTAGEPMSIKTGDMDGPTSWGVNARLALDPKVWWDPTNQQVMRGATVLDDFGSTSRVIKVPTFDPDDPSFSHSSDRSFTVTGFAYFFLEPGPQNGFYDPSDQLEIMGRFLFYAPGEGGPSGGGGPYSRFLRLVE